jgi:osmotically-inducible protein OsmY
MIMDDLALRALIEEELEFEPSLDAADIGVAVEGGIVTLTGHVKTYAEKVAAERAAQRVRGVRGIAQEIEVRYPGHKMIADDEIATRAVKIIDWDTTIPEGRVRVKVQNGWVTLTGEVEWYFQLTAAEDAVRKLSGITGVSNQIIVRPHIDPGNVRHRIEQALRRSPAFEGDSIDVEVIGGRVKLRGHVNAWHDRTLAERAAWSAPGVTTVEDHLTVA